MAEVVRLGLRVCDPDAGGLSAGRNPPCPREPTAAEVARWSSWSLALRSALPLELVGEYLDLGGEPEKQPIDYVAYTAWNLGICGIEGIRRQSCRGYGLTDARTWIGIAESAEWAFKEAGQTVGAIFRSVAPLLSFIPGIGQGVAAVLASVGALAAGEPIGSAVLEGLTNAIPGGGLARTAFESATAAAGAILDGENVGEAALRASRAALVAHGGPMAGAAFDGGLAVARGQALQEAGFAVLKNFARGNTLAERAARYAELVATATRDGRSIEAVLASSLASELGAVRDASAQVGRALEAIGGDPSWLEAGSEAFGLAAGVAEPAARAAQAVTRADGTVDPAALRAVLGVTAAEAMIARYGLARSRDLSAAAVLEGQREEAEASRLRASVALERAKVRTIDVMAAPRVATSAALERAKVQAIDVVAARPSVPAITAAAPRAPTKAEPPPVVIAAGVAASLGLLYLWIDDA